MQITEITVSYGQTQSLPEYCNVKPMVTLRATLDEGDDPARAYQELLLEARQAVESEIDDALERHDRPAVYSQEARFRVISTWQSHLIGEPKTWTPLENVVAIVPDSYVLRSGGDWRSAQHSFSDQGIRYRHALQVAQREAHSRKALRIIDCSDGDLSRLPQRPPALAEEGKEVPIPDEKGWDL